MRVPLFSPSAWRRFLLRALPGVCLLLPGLPLRAAEPSPGPEWKTEWQQGLIRWIQSLSPEDVTCAEKPFDFARLDPAEMRRNAQLAPTPASTLPMAYAALKLPAQSFLWQAIWHPELELTQTSLKGQGVEKGQIWGPTHPSIACLLGWLYAWDRPWNPYYHDPAVARRAAVISTLSLVMLEAGFHYNLSGEPGALQPPRGAHPHTGINGFSLTFNAFTYGQVADALPPEARKAWEAGLRRFAERLALAPPSGPENMQLSTPVGIYYTGLALKDEELKKTAERCMDFLIACGYSRAGYIRDAGVPDGSYNGISLHRLAEYWAISGSPRVLEVLRASYRLKSNLTLPEPDGSGTLSPSHFNARCQDGFDFDQYQGREVILLPAVPEAAWFARRFWPEDLSPEAVREQVETRLAKGGGRVPEAAPWGMGSGGTETQPHGWGRVLSLPYLLYHAGDEAKTDTLVRGSQLPVLAEERYSREFGGEFHIIRRPAYAAIFYTGPATASDKGATNYEGVLHGEGGYLMGMGGGGLSAFWTPQGGSLLLGRMTSKEGYERKKNVGENNALNVPGWQDWLHNEIIGETAEGKILYSARVCHPRSRLLPEKGPQKERLEIRGEMPRALPRQGAITDARVSYRRTYTFDDERIACEVVVESDKALPLRSLYEALPLVLTTGRKLENGPATLSCEDAAGRPLEATGPQIEGVCAVVLKRYQGGMRIAFPTPVTLCLDSEPTVSKQFTFVQGRSLLVAFPAFPAPGAPARLTYELIPDTAR